MLLMNITLKITPAEHFKLGLLLQPIADATKIRIKNRQISPKVEYLLITEFMQSFNYNKFDFKDQGKSYNFSIRLSTGIAILTYIMEQQIQFEIGMIEERSIADKLNRQILNYGISFYENSKSLF